MYMASLVSDLLWIYIRHCKNYSIYSTFSALAHLLHKSTSCCHDGDRFHTNALSTSRFVYTCIDFPVLVAKSHMCFVFTHP